MPTNRPELERLEALAEALARSEDPSATEPPPRDGALPEDGADGLLDGLERRMAQERGLAAWLRCRSTGVRRALGLGAALAIALAVLLTQRRGDLGALPLWRLGLELGLLALISGAALWYSLRPLHEAEPGPGVLWTLIVVALLAPLGIALIPSAQGHGGCVGDAVSTASLRCMASGLVMGLPILLLARLLDRGGHGSLRRAVLAASGAGLAALTAVEIRCPAANTAHLLGGHVPIVVALVGIYWLVARRARSRRADTGRPPGREAREGSR